MVAGNCIWSFKFRLKIKSIKYNFKFIPSVALATFQVLDNHMWLMAAIQDSAETEHIHHCRKSSQGRSRETGAPILPESSLKSCTYFLSPVPSALFSSKTKKQPSNSIKSQSVFLIPRVCSWCIAESCPFVL